MSYNIAPAKQNLLNSSSTLQLAVGSNSAPSFSFSGQTNSGMYKNAWGGPAFTANGTLRLECTYYTQVYGDLSISQALTVGTTLNATTVSCASNSGNLRWAADQLNNTGYPSGIGRGWEGVLIRPNFIDVANTIRVGKKITDYRTYGSTLMVSQTDPFTTNISASTNASTAVTTSGGLPEIYINVGDYIQLNGLATIARVVSRSAPNMFVVDTAIGDGTSRAVIQHQDVASFRKADGTEALLINRTGDIVSSQNLIVSAAGKGLQIKEGSNAKMGTATMVAGTVTVSTTAVTANSRIFLTKQESGTPVTLGALRVSARTANTSFAISSDNVADTSDVAWMLVEPA